VQEFVNSEAMWKLIEPLVSVREKKVHPMGLSLAEDSRPSGIKRHLLRVANGLSVESLGCDRYLQGFNCPRALPGMAKGRGLRLALENRAV